MVGSLIPPGPNRSATVRQIDNNPPPSDEKVVTIELPVENKRRSFKKQLKRLSSARRLSISSVFFWSLRRSKSFSILFLFLRL